MHQRNLICATLIPLVAGMTPVAYAGTCNGTQAIRTITKDSATLQLGNGSRWQIARPDLIDTTAWHPNAVVLTCDNALVNLDINEDTRAKQLP